MRVLERRFLRGPNIHCMAPCFVLLLDLEGHRPVGLGELPDAAALLATLMPRDCAAVVDAAEVARLLARLMVAMQAWAGRPATSCKALSVAPTAPGRYRLICGYQDEAVAEEALRLSVELLTALLRHQPFELNARLGELRALADARASVPAAQALLQSARERGIPVTPLKDDGRCFALGWGVRQQHYHARPPTPVGQAMSLGALFAEKNDGRIPVVAVTGTNGKTTTTQLIAHVWAPA